MNVTLCGATRRLRQLIREHGALWTVHERRPHVPCLNGPGVLISPEGTSRQHRALRWVTPDLIRPSG